MRLETERLILRIISESDVNELFILRSHPEVNKFVQRNSPKNTFEALNFILTMKNREARNEIVFLGISLKNSFKVIGTICLWKFSEDRKTAEVGYELLPEFHGNGIMYEALEKVLDFGFNELSLENIEAFTSEKNEKSIGLLKKFSFQCDEFRKDMKFPQNKIFNLNLSDFSHR